MDAGRTAGQPVLEVDGVDVSYGGRRVLVGVTFSVAPGELAGLIGANGTGKTTLFKVILGQLTPDAGRVTLSGGRRVGYVPQRIELDPEMPVRARDLVALGLDGARVGLARRSRGDAEVVEEIIAAVGAESFADRRVGALSGGEQQRVLLAHALVSRPPLVLLDEPLANLDPGSTQEIINVLARLRDEQGVAIVISAHEMNPLLPVMDRLVYVANGRVASGSIDEVVQPGVLSALYGHHVDVIRVHGRILVVTGSPEPTGPAAVEHGALVVE